MQQQLNQEEKINVAIFASGAGSNAKKIIGYFKGHPFIHIALVVSNKPNAGVIQVAERCGLPVLLLNKERFFNGDGYVEELREKDIGFIVLAGFLWKIPPVLLKAYPRHIINIHPALLPKFGGKGMYGGSVHEAVLSAGEERSGITIHFVDEHYDNGDIIFQASCPVVAGDTAASLAEKIHALEHENYPVVIEEVISASFKTNTGK